jgi:hypothetical protein
LANEACPDRDTQSLWQYASPLRSKSASNDCPTLEMTPDRLSANRQQSPEEKIRKNIKEAVSFSSSSY